MPHNYVTSAPTTSSNMFPLKVAIGSDISRIPLAYSLTELSEAGNKYL
jgi:hypothetical protein